MSLTPATQALLSWPYRLLRTELGRRATTAMLVSAVLAVTVQTLYANADPPSVLAATAGGAPGRAGTPTATKTKGTGKGKGTAKGTDKAASGRERAAAPSDPAKAAIAWYARKRGVAADKVTLLQQRRKNDNEVRVLLMAEIGDRLDTIDVKVRRTSSGWKVP